MNLITRRRFVAVTSVAATSAVLVACGNDPATDEELNPTQIPDVPGAPPTLAPITSTPGAEAPAEDAPAGDTGTATAEAIVVTAHDDFSFSPNQVEVAPGQTVTVTNEGFMQHDLVSDDLGVGTALLNNGESEDIVIPEDATVGETYHFICTVAGHEQSGMVGDFIIVEAGAAAPAAAEEETTEEEPAEEEAGAAAPSGEAVTITALDSFAFEPNQVEVAPGQTVTVTNEGFMQHDLVSDDLGVGTELLNNGEREDFVIPEDATVGETYHFICTVAGHEQSGMVGDFIIVEAGAAAPAAEEEAPAEEEPAEEEASAAEEGAAAPSGEAVTITALDSFAFEPNQVEVFPGQTVTLVNEGFMQHDLVSDDLGVGTELLNNGESEDIVIPEDAAVGESYHFICTVAGHEQSGMVGDFIIVEGGGSAAAATGEEAPAEEEEATEEAAAEGTPAADNTPMATTVIGTQWEFSPSEFEMAPGGVITFQNDTDMMMGVSSEEWDDGGAIIPSIGDGRTAEFTVPEDAEVGSVITFQSNLSEAVKQGMVGEITIVAGEGGAATPVATPEEGAAGTGEAITIVARDNFSFEPNEVEVTPGQTVTLVNEGFMQHDLVSEDLGVGTELLNNSQSEDIVIPEDATVGETYHFICTVAGHEQSGMVGDFIIV